MHTASLELLHHPLHLLKLLKQTVNFLHLHTGTFSNSLLTRRLKKLGFRALFDGHGIDNTLSAAKLLFSLRALHLPCHTGKLSRQLFEH